MKKRRQCHWRRSIWRGSDFYRGLAPAGSACLTPALLLGAILAAMFAIVSTATARLGAGARAGIARARRGAGRLSAGTLVALRLAMAGATCGLERAFHLEGA